MLMKFAILCAAALVGAPALADELVASNGNDQVRLSTSPCTNEQVLNRLKPQFRAVLRHASATVAGQTFKACWLAEGKLAHLLYEDGDQGLIPLAAFKVPLSA
jgi:hypothetical protein